MRTILAITLALTATACASAPVAPLPAVIAPTFEDKMAWILRLEDQRALRDPVAVVAAQPTPPPDLVRLLADPEARVRRRAALAVGRVGLAAGVGPVAALLGDADPEVRQMAAFALGLIGDKTALEPLIRALDDPSPLVEGSAAQALGLIGDRSAADALGRLAVRLVQAGAVADVPAEDADVLRDLPASAFRLAIYALARLNAYDQLAAAVLDSSGQPKVRWWPVAYALQRVADKRALPALLTLAKDSHPYTQAFAVKGLGELKDPGAVPVLLPLLTSRAPTLTIEALGALGLIADPGSADAVLRLLRAKDTDSAVRVAATGILGSLRAQGAADMLLDSLSDSNPAVRSASLRALAALDPDQFVLVVSGLDPDPDWTVRAALASVLGALPSDASVPRLTTMLRDPDQRVLPAVLRALVKRHAPGVAEILLRHLEADDPAVRAASAAGLEETRPAGGAAALADAYRSGARDATHVVRAAALTALAAYGVDAARPSLQAALADKDWAVRVRAAALLKQLDPSSAADVDAQIRPAPTTVPPGAYREKRLVSPPFSTAIYIDTDRGTIQLELLVLDAPLTVENFVTLARKGFFNGLSVHRVVPGFVTQTGDPRGDGEGGPGYTVRDEINEHPYLRGTVGMALDSWGDTGGSQFFVTLAPQPQLDGRYTVFARVVSGMDVVDEIQENDVIRRVRVWDGETMSRAFGSPAFGF